ncbi:RNA polymerase sigma factor [Amycolatopsis sp. lyj-109]|uniref:RNA polymerase sigma factor n=1 Tax=Amycolatopsis sp. lyj-109 TaxID=2789287 RepID=UPI00397C7E73
MTADLPKAERETVFRALFERHFGELARLAGLLGADDAEDVVQEAFVRLHRFRAPLTDEAQVARRLRAHVVRLARRRRARRDRPLDGLPRRHREVLVLRYGFALGTVDIAETLALSPHAVEAAAHRALEKLRRQEDRSRTPTRRRAVAVAAAFVVAASALTVSQLLPDTTAYRTDSSSSRLTGSGETSNISPSTTTRSEPSRKTGPFLS